MNIASHVNVGSTVTRHVVQALARLTCIYAHVHTTHTHTGEHTPPYPTLIHKDKPLEPPHKSEPHMQVHVVLLLTNWDI